MKPFSGIPRYVNVGLSNTHAVRFPANVIVYLDCKQFAQTLIGSNLNESLAGFWFMWLIWLQSVEGRLYYGLPAYGQQLLIDRLKVASDAEQGSEGSYTCKVCSEVNCSTATTYVRAFGKSLYQIFYV